MIAHLWSSSFIQCHKEGPEKPCPGHDWRLIVYIPGNTIEGCVEDAIRNNLKCDKRFHDQTMVTIADDGDGVLIISDATDELQDEDLKESLCQFAQECKEFPNKPSFLLSSRTGLCFIDPQHFHRCLNIEGFTIPQGIQYLEAHFRERYSVSDHAILEYVKENSQKLEMVLCNPLRMLIFSELTAKGELKLDDIKTLHPVKLLKYLEEYIVTGEMHKVTTKSQHTGHTMFYKTCLECFLKGENRLLDKDLENSPYKAFLTKQTNDEGMGSAYYTFSHMLIFEYFTVRGFVDSLWRRPRETRAVLLHLCSDPNMRNILQLASGFICQCKPELFDNLVSIIRACLFLQCNAERCVRNEGMKNLLHLPSVMPKLFPSTELLETPQKDVKLVVKMRRKIDAAFTGKDVLKKGKWFKKLFKGQL